MEELAAWVEWLANECPPWAAYRATKNCRLAALDKRPGVRPVGIALVWDRVVCKPALSSTGLNVKAACGSKQLCAGLEAGIEGAMHAVLEQSTADSGMQFDGRRQTQQRQSRQRRRRTKAQLRGPTPGWGQRRSGPGCSRSPDRRSRRRRRTTRGRRRQSPSS